MNKKLFICKSAEVEGKFRWQQLFLCQRSRGEDVQRKEITAEEFVKRFCFAAGEPSEWRANRMKWRSGDVNYFLKSQELLRACGSGLACGAGVYL